MEIARELRRDRGAATNGGDGDAVDAVDATNAPSRDERAFGRRVKKKQTRRDDEAMIRVVVWLVAFPFYAVFATVGYLGFGRDVSGDVLTEWIGDGEMAVAQIAVAGVNVLKYPLMGFALRGIVVAAADDAYARLARKNRGRARRRMPDERERLETRLLTASLLLLDGEDAEEASDASRGERARRETSSTSSVVSPHRDGASNEKPNAPPFVRAAALFAAHASVASCAVLLRRLALALDLIGATCGVTVAFIVPGWVLWCSLGKATSVGAADGGETARLRDRVLAATLVAAGVATSACGVAAVAAELV